MSFAIKWMELEVMMLSEISQFCKYKLHDFSHLLKLGKTKKGHENKRGTTRDMEQEKESGGR
jgi:hypothetical protein